MAKTAVLSKSDQTHADKTKTGKERATFEKDKTTLKRDLEAKLAAAGNRRAEARATVDAQHREQTRKIWDTYRDELAKLADKRKTDQ